MCRQFKPVSKFFYAAYSQIDNFFEVFFYGKNLRYHASKGNHFYNWNLKKNFFIEKTYLRNRVGSYSDVHAWVNLKEN